MSERLGDNIKAAREAAGLTQEELGAKIGVTGVTIMRYEKGQREPKIDVVTKIADVLGVTNGQLLGWSREPDAMDEAVLSLYPGYDPKDTIPEYLARKDKGPEPSQPARPEVTDDDIKFALFGGAGEITDEMFGEVKRFARFLKQERNG